MASAAINKQIEEKLRTAGLGFEEIKVFGVLRCNVHVVCQSRETAAKWVALLSQSFKGAKVVSVDHVWNAAHNKNTVLKPTLRKGFLIALAY